MDSNPKVVSIHLLKEVKDRDFLTHLESYLAKCGDIDKLLKISRYITKIALSYSLPPPPNPPPSFESSVGLSRNTFRLGKFVQDINACPLHHHPISVLSRNTFRLGKFVRDINALCATTPSLYSPYHLQR
ncbi:peroxisomal membrane protein 11A [Cinnamomum micranthum f. kanehirae]|uniref:Peroxisomal membrane protein 11A n=1 Tax=Cinnamomum micranthum f. kanehirae TaxID=337451 RepID=A0A443PAC8_9MAGN|nr:peroxisomal membrane protein 11A [Cinnamomum micranthum f. kanehirae]